MNVKGMTRKGILMIIDEMACSVFCRTHPILPLESRAEMAGIIVAQPSPDLCNGQTCVKEIADG